MWGDPAQLSRQGSCPPKSPAKGAEQGLPPSRDRWGQQLFCPPPLAPAPKEKALGGCGEETPGCRWQMGPTWRRNRAGEGRAVSLSTLGGGSFLLSGPSGICGRLGVRMPPPWGEERRRSHRNRLQDLLGAQPWPTAAPAPLPWPAPSRTAPPGPPRRPRSRLQSPAGRKKGGGQFCLLHPLPGVPLPPPRQCWRKRASTQQVAPFPGPKLSNWPGCTTPAVTGGHLIPFCDRRTRQASGEAGFI